MKNYPRNASFDVQVATLNARFQTDNEQKLLASMMAAINNIENVCSKTVFVTNGRLNTDAERLTAGIDQLDVMFNELRALSYQWRFIKNQRSSTLHLLGELATP